MPSIAQQEQSEYLEVGGSSKVVPCRLSIVTKVDDAASLEYKHSIKQVKGAGSG